MSKNILYITVRADVGGGPKHLSQLSEKMAHKGFNVFIASPMETPFGEKFKSIARDHIEIPHRRITPLSFFKVLKFCKKNRIDIVHSQGRGAGFYSRLLKIFGFKVIHTFHGVHAEKSFKNSLSLFIERLLKLFTDIFVCVSRDEFSKALQYNVINEGRTKVIPNGVELPKTVKDSRFEGDLVLGALTRFDPMKGNDILIKYFFKLENSKDIKLVIAGDGDQRESLEKLTKKLGVDNRVEFRGDISDLNSFFNEIDILVSCSKGEGLPLSILEAQAFGVPTLLSDVKGHMEIGKDGCAKLFKLNSFEDFKSAFNYIKEEQNHIKIKCNALKMVKSKYNLQRMVEDYICLYENS